MRLPIYTAVSRLKRCVFSSTAVWAGLHHWRANKVARCGGRDLVGRRCHSRSLESLHVSQGVDANQSSVPTMWLREVLADQSDRGHRANVSGWRESTANHYAIESQVISKREIPQATRTHSTPAYIRSRAELAQRQRQTHASLHHVPWRGGNGDCGADS